MLVVAIGLFLILALFRAVSFIRYAIAVWNNPEEAYYLEAKMVHLAWRVQHQVRLYPSWRTGPHVANFFGPVYFGMVGWIGQALGSGLDGLFRIARGTTLAGDLITTALVMVVAKKRCGWFGALLAGVLSVGAGPMIGYGAMARPDTLADALGLLGFLVATAAGRGRLVAGGVLLLLAVLTKQTAGMYLGAACLSLWLMGRRKPAIGLGVGVVLTLAVFVGLITLLYEPEFGPCLLGEAGAPWAWTEYRVLLGRTVLILSEMHIGLLVGVGLWAFGPRRDPRLLGLAIVLGLACLVSALKLGSDLNYFLPWRAVTSVALAEFAGLLWAARGGRLVLGLTLWLGCGHALTLSAIHTNVQMAVAIQSIERSKSPAGRLLLQQRERLKGLARDPAVSLLTDRGVLDIEQGERTLFGDPWLFRILAEGNRLDLTKTIQALEEERYDVLITHGRLDDPAYLRYDFRLPQPLVDAASAHYTFQQSTGALMIYRPNRPKSDPKP
mgnify:CR=1 FL=1